MNNEQIKLVEKVALELTDWKAAICKMVHSKDEILADAPINITKQILYGNNLGIIDWEELGNTVLPDWIIPLDEVGK